MTNFSQKGHFVFDLDDTLTDSQAFCGLIMAKAITSFEKHVSRNAVLDFHSAHRGKSIDHLYRSAISKFHLTTPLSALVKADAQIMLAHCHQITPFVGVKELLTSLKLQGKKLYLCTNRKSDSLVPILKHTGLRRYFDQAISCTDAQAEKPDPKCLNLLVSKTNQPKDKFIYIGDTEKDYQFARNAGVDCLIVDQYLSNGKFFSNLHSSFLS